MAEGDYFKEALGDFIRNFAYGDDIRKLVAARIEDQPFYEDIAKVETYLKNNPLRLK